MSVIPSDKQVLEWVTSTRLRPDHDVLTALGYKVDVPVQSDRRYNGPLTVDQQVWIVKTYFEDTIIYKPSDPFFRQVITEVRDCLTPIPDHTIYSVEHDSHSESGLVVFQTISLEEALVEFIRYCWDVKKTPTYDSESKEWTIPDEIRQVCSAINTVLMVRHNEFFFRFGCRSSYIVSVSKEWSPCKLADVSEEEWQCCQELNRHPILVGFREAVENKRREVKRFTIPCYCYDCYDYDYDDDISDLDDEEDYSGQGRFGPRGQEREVSIQYCDAGEILELYEARCSEESNLVD